jgi:hypothetical protein
MSRSTRRLINTLREYPTTEDFVYLKRMDQNLSVYDPYSLEVVPFTSVDQKDFYTLSVRGMTHYLDGVSADFASEREGWALMFLLQSNWMPHNGFIGGQCT